MTRARSNVRDLLVGAVLVAAVLSGCSSDRPDGHGASPRPSATPFTVALGSYCTTLEHLRDANRDPGSPRTVARTLTRRLEVLSATYRHLAAQDGDDAAVRAWRRMARDAGSAHDALAAAGGNLSDERVLLRLAVLRDTMERELSSLDGHLRERCGVSAADVAGTSVQRPAGS